MTGPALAQTVWQLTTAEITPMPKATPSPENRANPQHVHITQQECPTSNPFLEIGEKMRKNISTSCKTRLFIKEFVNRHNPKGHLSVALIVSLKSINYTIIHNKGQIMR